MFRRSLVRLDEKPIGAGTFGTVHKAVRVEDGVPCAAKIIIVKTGMRDSPGQRTMDFVVECLMAFMVGRKPHPRIVEFLGFGRREDEERRDDRFEVVLLMELATNGTVLDALNECKEPFAESRARKYNRQILEGISYLHGEGVIHRDIKPNNVLLTDEDNIKLADFGGSTWTADGTTKSLAGTLCYMAPEILKGEVYGHKVDIFSAGVTLIQMLTKRLPYVGTHDEACSIPYKVRYGKIAGFDSPKCCSAGMQTFIQHMVHFDPAQRSDADWLLANEGMIDRSPEEVETVKDQIQQMQMTSPSDKCCPTEAPQSSPRLDSQPVVEQAVHQKQAIYQARSFQHMEDAQALHKFFLLRVFFKAWIKARSLQPTVDHARDSLARDSLETQEMFQTQIQQQARNLQLSQQASIVTGIASSRPRAQLRSQGQRNSQIHSQSSCQAEDNRPEDSFIQQERSLASTLPSQFGDAGAMQKEFFACSLSSQADADTVAALVVICFLAALCGSTLIQALPSSSHHIFADIGSRSGPGASSKLGSDAASDPPPLRHPSACRRGTQDAFFLGSRGTQDVFFLGQPRAMVLV
eukprot:CAMPEP_0181292054 /NCGR_PEP_ID=MMETSP1101-20121128/2298_1 /TAXON_ID=46948 /ORGANISM="Rhodomonas abbreviata, Strain Caron Lab Isolate" /LENGTH=578 /DNA_ID=CAMNT_0023396491 /DNA_START=115 /DNA_END=1851 /DNA_ORIENTATION=+